MSGFSRITIEQYLPIVKSIFASFEVQDKANIGMEKMNSLSVDYLEREFDGSKLLHTMRMLNIWLDGSVFKAGPFYFTRPNNEVPWSEMLKIIESKIIEYSNGVPVIVLTLASSGRIAREVNGVSLKCDFAADKLKLQILTWLPEDGEYVKTQRLMGFIGSKSAESLSKMVAKINSDTASKLQLPKNQPLIDSKKNSGYRINPIYNLVRTK